MMMFRTLKSNLETILSRNARGRYTVFGYQQQAIDASEVLDVKRRVQVFYDSGSFSKGMAGLTGNTQHEITFRVELSVSAAAEANLAVINDENSNADQVAAAISCFQTAAKLADDGMDEFLEIIYQILMDGRNVDLDTEGPPYTVSNRWLGGMNKSDTVPQGEYVILTASIDFTCQAIEEVTGDTGTAAGTGPFDITDDLVGDDIEKTGSIT